MMYKITDNVTRHVLPNGLTVLLKENHSSPVAAVLAHVKAGYFHEPDNLSGITHVIEHMLFKGTEKFPGRDRVAEEVRSMGGTLNAGTYYEDTYYHITVPSTNLDRAIEVQADMIERPLIDPDELRNELEVIIQESKQKRDNPTAMLVETLYAKAFDRHRIRRWRIGEDSALRALRATDLKRFMRNAYCPGNIILSIVGDILPDRVISVVEKHWRGDPRGSLRPECSDQEDSRTDFRYYRVNGDINQRLFAIAYHAPTLLSPDSAPLMLLEHILSDGRSSRLFRSIREKQGLVGSVWASYECLRTLGVFTLGAEVNDDDPLAASRAIIHEVRDLSSDGVKADELERVRTRIKSRLVTGQEEVLGMARNLAWYEAAGSYEMADELPAKLLAVSGTEITELAKRYSNLEGATLLEYLPSKSKAPSRSITEVRETIFPTRRPASVRPAPPESGRPEENVLKNGGALIFRRRTDLPLVAVHVLFPGGRRYETRFNAGITNLMLKSMLKGTGTRTAGEISLSIEALGSGIGISHAVDYFGFSLKALSSRFTDCVDVLRDVLNNPAFPSEEVEKEKTAILGVIRRQRDSMRSRAFELLDTAIYGDAPYGLPSSGLEEAIAALTAADLEQWWRTIVCAKDAIISVTGDIRSDEAAAAITGIPPVGSPSNVKAVRSVTLTPNSILAETEREQTASAMAFPGVAIDHDDRFALDLLAEITSGQSGRFFKAVRGENALAYAVSSFHRSRQDAGNFLTYTATSPDKEEAARDLIVAECERLASDLIPDDELNSAKEAFRGEYLIGSQTFSSQAGEVALYRLYGRSLDYSETYLTRISALQSRDLRAAAERYLCSGTRWLGVARGRAKR